MEEWRDIKGFEGLYQVSNLGRVKKLNYRGKENREKILKGVPDKDGYLRIHLHKYNKSKTKRIHRLVAECFIENPNNYPMINHIDENKQNNNVENLEWCTTKYNNTYGMRIEKAAISKSKKVICITTGEKFDSIKEAARKYKISNGRISANCKNKSKSAGRHPITREKLVWKYL